MYTQDYSHPLHMYLCTSITQGAKSLICGAVLGMHGLTSSSPSSGAENDYPHFTAKKTEVERLLW